MLTTTILTTPDETLSLDDKGQILWLADDKHLPVAHLTKGKTITEPGVSLLNANTLEAEEAKNITNHIQTWVDAHIKTVLAPLLSLEDIALSGAGKGIAFQLFEKFGFLYRKDVADLIKEISKEDRQFLGKRGMRLGAYYVYQRDMLKPAAVSLRSALWLAFNGENKYAVTPPAGNVSMTVDKNAPKDFYRIIGFPIFGTTAVRLDMVERVNSAVYDGAKEGKYVFDPALASTIGVSVDALYLVLADLGFKYDAVTEEIPAKEGEEDPTQKETRTYHLKKAPIKALRSKRPPQKGKGAKAKTTPKQEKQPDPNSPFAALQGLIKK